MADDEESLEERQENEVEALKAIYDVDFEDLRAKDVWKVRRPPEFMLKISPDHDSRGGGGLMQADASCCLVLHVKCDERYPTIPPTIKLKEAKGVKHDLVLELQDEVTAMADKMKGEVMVMEIAQHVSSWLQVKKNLGGGQAEIECFLFRFNNGKKSATNHSMRKWKSGTKERPKKKQRRRNKRLN